jgi:hypothetical protein
MEEIEVSLCVVPDCGSNLRLEVYQLPAWVAGLRRGVSVSLREILSGRYLVVMLVSLDDW